MKRENIVIPECYVDTNLMNVLIGKTCNHQKGCATVCKLLDTKLSNQFAVAIIDKDKNEPKAVEQYRPIGENNYLVVNKHLIRPHYLIQIKPAVEVFILDAVHELNVNLSDYGLPNDLNSLRKVTKTTTAKEDVIFFQLFSALRSASNILCLNNILNYLLDNRYSASEEEIQRLLQV